MDKEQKNKLENILFHEHSWSQKDIDDLDMKIEDIIDAYEQTKQFAISRVSCQRGQLKEFYNKMFMTWVEENTMYDENGFYLYKKDLWGLEELSKIYQNDILNL